MIGDYQSLLIIAFCPKFCPPMSSASIALYIKWKHGEKQSPLLDYEGNSMKDVDGNVVLCDGGWNDPKIVGQFNTAVKAVHNAKGHRGDYQESCSECFELEKKGCGHEGCTNHRGQNFGQNA
jgi:hypothetical protein